MKTRIQKGRKAGFTLLELLVVVAILAIIAGAIIVAYDGLESQSAKVTASHSIAAVDQAVRTFTSVGRSAPSNLDSLISATNGNPADTDAKLYGTDGIGTMRAERDRRRRAR